MEPRYSMTPHNPPESWGDCHRACVASIVEVAPWEVPHIWEGYDGTDDQIEVGRRNDILNNWLLDRGFILHNFYVHGTHPVEELIDNISEANPGVYWILSGWSSNGANHAVICRNGEVVHNPTPGSEIDGPMDDGTWLIEMLGSTVGFKEA